MAQTGNICVNYERASSSGMIFNGNAPRENGRDNFNKLNEILFCLVEEEMELSVRSLNCLTRAGVRLIGELVQKSEAQLFKLHNFGRTSLHEIREILDDMDLTLEMKLDFPPWNGEGAELVEILSMRQAGGGFHINDRIAGMVGVDVHKLKMEASKIENSVAGDKVLLLSTVVIVKFLEERFAKKSPHIFDLIQKNKKWLQRELKRDVTDVISKQLKTIHGGN